MSNDNNIWRKLFGFLVGNKLIPLGLAGFAIFAGLMVEPFGWNVVPSVAPVAVDALPNLGENQQVVVTRWSGRSPRDVEDQITFPLTSSLLGMRGVKAVRSSSMLGLSLVTVVFHEDVDFDVSRSRLSEKLGALPPGALPPEVKPQPGPEATALGQVYWYTLEGHTDSGERVGGWDLHELRTIQDVEVRPALQSVDGVAEVAGIGGFQEEFHIEVNPDLLLLHSTSLQAVRKAVAEASLDSGAGTIELNNVEYALRVTGNAVTRRDLEESIVVMRGETPLTVEQVAKVFKAPKARRGLLDKNGRPAVGGVVTMAYGANTREVIERVRARVDLVAASLPQRTLANGTTSRVTIVPFYDRSQLIDETVGTLSTALVQQIALTLVVLFLFLRSLRLSVVVGLVPFVGVLLTLASMSLFGVQANIMTLVGIALAIGTMVDMGIVLSEAIFQTRDENGLAEESVVKASSRIGPAVVTAASTTIASFLPVFLLSGDAGKLFTPLALTKTLAMVAAVVVTFLVVPALAHTLYSRRIEARTGWLENKRSKRIYQVVVLAILALALVAVWQPAKGVNIVVNGLVVVLFLASAYGAITLLNRHYEKSLSFCLRHRKGFYVAIGALLLASVTMWQGLPKWDVIPQKIRSAFPGFQNALMPSFDEGAFLYMPVTMPHASVGVVGELLSEMDARIASVPEVKNVVGKAGRVDSALDPAPLSMFENIVTYHPEYGRDDQGVYKRLWREHIKSPDDIWQEIQQAATMVGLTQASPLGPLKTRVVMLRTGLNTSTGMKIFGKTIEEVNEAGLALESIVASVKSVKKGTALYRRVGAKPYIEISPRRDDLKRHGISMKQFHDTVETALAGKVVGGSIIGRQRIPLRVRYARDFRTSLSALEDLLVPTNLGKLVPLKEMSDVNYIRGPQAILTEDNMPVGYLSFSAVDSATDSKVVRDIQRALDQAIGSKSLVIPSGIRWEFAGSYKEQQETSEKMRLIVPMVVGVVFLFLYLMFRKVGVALIVFFGVIICMAGGFVLLWTYGALAGANIELGSFDIGAMLGFIEPRMTTAVWIGFLVLAGIATDVGVVLAGEISLQLKESNNASPTSALLAAGRARLLPCALTAATTGLALLPIITSQGRGSEIMLPVALPVLGGMITILLTLYTVPVMYSHYLEWTDQDGKSPK